MEPSVENYLAQVLQKDLGRRLQVGQEIIDYITDKDKSHDLEQDQTALDRMVDGIANSWVNSSNFKVSCAVVEQWESGLNRRAGSGQTAFAICASVCVLFYSKSKATLPLTEMISQLWIGTSL